MRNSVSWPELGSIGRFISMRIWRVCLASIVLHGLPVLAQSTTRPNAEIARGATTIQLFSQWGKFYAPAKVNGQDLGVFTVDTGSSVTTINHATAAKLKVVVIAQKTLDKFEGPKKEDLILLDKLEVGPQVLQKHPAFICDCEIDALSSGQAIIGAIGMDVLGRQPFSINFREPSLTLYESASFVPPISEVFQLRPGDDRPHVRASIEGHEGWFAIDTGYPDWLLLSLPFLGMNTDLALGRPRVRDGLSWSENAASYRVRWNSADILGLHLDEAFGDYDANDRFGPRIAGLIGSSRFRESVLTLDMASRRGWVQQLEVEPLDTLVERLEDKTRRGRSSLPPLHQAVVLKREDAVRQLLALGEAPDQTDDRGTTPLTFASARDYGEIMGMLLTYGAKVDVPTKIDASTPLLFAAWFGRAGAARQLLDAGADVNRASASGRTPLFVAAEAGFGDLVRLLLERGAKVDQALLSGETPLLAACNNGNTEIAAMLLARKANPNATGLRGTCLSYAAAAASVDCVKLLLKSGADPNRHALQGATPLMAAAGINSLNGVECVRLLLDAGADPTVKSVDADQANSGKTAFDIAVERGQVESVKLLHDRVSASPSTRASKP